MSSPELVDKTRKPHTGLKTIARLTRARRVEARNLSSFILVPSLRIHISYSCRCQAKRMYLSLVAKATVAFLSLYFLWGTLNTGAGRPAVSPQASGRFHRTQFKKQALQNQALQNQVLRLGKLQTWRNFFLPNHFTFRAIHNYAFFITRLAF